MKNWLCQNSGSKATGGKSAAFSGLGGAGSQAKKSGSGMEDSMGGIDSKVDASGAKKSGEMDLGGEDDDDSEGTSARLLTPKVLITHNLTKMAISYSFWPHKRKSTKKLET